LTVGQQKERYTWTIERDKGGKKHL